MKNSVLLFIASVLLSACIGFEETRLDKADYAALTPDSVLGLMMDGNGDFVKGRLPDCDVIKRRRITAEEGQHPKAIVLACMDSRVPVEDIFNCGLGDIFVLRIAGNVSDTDILGSMEYACELSGAKLVMVLGHSSCGAVHGAIIGEELGNLTGLLKKITPSLEQTKNRFPGTASKSNPAFADAVSKANVKNTLREIRDNSHVLKEMEEHGKIKIVGAFYEIGTGEVKILGE